MNDSELNGLLREHRVPERAWEELAADTVRLAQSAASHGARRGTSPHGRRWKPAFALWAVGAAACVLAGFFVDHWHARRVQSVEVAAARKIFSELNALFPNQIESVVLEGATPRLALANKAFADKGAPLFIRLCGDSGCQRVITYSGQRVTLNGESCEVLLDSRGHVIVTGERFVWSSGDVTKARGGYRIQAAPLEML